MQSAAYCLKYTPPSWNGKQYVYSRTLETQHLDLPLIDFDWNTT